MRATGVEAVTGGSPSVDTFDQKNGQTENLQAVKPDSGEADSARLVHTQDTSAASTSCADVAQKPAQHAERLPELVVKWITLDDVTREAILTLAGLHK